MQCLPVTLSADERRGRSRQVRVGDGLERRELLAAELEEGDRLVEILQAMLAEVGELAVDEPCVVAETTT